MHLRSLSSPPTEIVLTMAWRGSLSRSLISTARASTIRSSPPLPRLRPSTFAAPRLQPRRFSFANPRVEWKRWVICGAVNHREAGQ